MKAVLILICALFSAQVLAQNLNVYQTNSAAAEHAARLRMEAEQRERQLQIERQRQEQEARNRQMQQQYPGYQGIPYQVNRGR